MGDLIRARLTGLFRDSGVVTAITKDPGCELQYIDLDAPGGPLKTAMVMFTNGTGVPWYAAMSHFFGTVTCTTGTVSPMGTPLRTYEVSSSDINAIITTLAIRSDDGAGTVCIEIPIETCFHGIVLGRTGPEFGSESLPAPANVLEWDNWSSQPIPASGWGRLVFVAPDGSSYGAGMDSTRWVFGYYPGLRGTSVGSAADREAHLTYSQPALQYGTNVVLVTARPDAQAAGAEYETQYAWHILPGEAPPANIVMARDGTDSWSDSFAEFDTAETYDRPMVMAFNTALSPPKWVPATVLPTNPPPAAPDHSARNDRVILGVSLGTNGGGDATGLKTLHIVTQGRFWLNPANYTGGDALKDNTAYYIWSGAVAGGGPGVGGEWDSVPCSGDCRRPVFVHHTDGWCTMCAQHLGPSQRFRYDDGSMGGDPLEAIIEAVDADNTDGVGRVAFKDFANTSDKPERTGGETDEILAWFTSKDAEKRALVVKRGDLVVNIGDPEAGARGSQLCFPYLKANRVTDTYDPSATDWEGWFTIQAYPSDTSKGHLSFYDGDTAVLKWYGNKVPDPSPVGSTRKRKFEFNVDVEHIGGWSWAWQNHSGQELVVIKEQDFSAMPHVVMFNSLGRFLKIREIEVCDSANPENTAFIAILASDEYPASL